MAEAACDPGSEEQEELLVDEATGLTTQWTVEDEEEAAQEQRRHERDQLLKAEDEDTRAQSPEPRQDTLLNLEPSEAPELDEDEGFGDWSQKPGQRGLLEVRGASQEDSLQENRALGPVQSSCGRAGSCHISTHLQPTYVMEALRPRAARPFLPRVWPASIPTEEGSSSQGQEQKDNHEAGHTEALLEGLNLNPGMEPQAGLDVEKTETQGMEEPAQDSQGPAGAGEAEEKPPQCQQGRTPSPLTLEGATEHSPPPLSPTTKLVDRTESLNRSINKSVKKSEPALPVSKIDVRLEQYTQAIEGASRTPKLARQPSIELPSMGVASTKSLWETGEVQAQSAAKGPSCKDIVAGDMSKRSLWEQRGGSKTSSTIKSTPSGKRYKFVATGHGKYEKVLMDEGAAP